MKNKTDFEQLFGILQDKHFLAMEGLGNEVPFFIHAYPIEQQEEIYTGMDHLSKKLRTSGVNILQIGLYDLVIDVLKKEGFWDDIFPFELENTKEELSEQMVNLFTKDTISNYIQEKLEEDSYQIIFINQVGEVYPYLRTHDLLNWIQSYITMCPVVTFFPGEYQMSKEAGFHLNLFGRIPGPYYRAFRLDEYNLRR